MGFQIKCTKLMQFTDNDVINILSKHERNLDTVQVDIDSIKKWIEDQKHLPLMPSDQQIFIFLVMNKFSIEKTKEKFDMYYTIRTLIPDYYNNLLPSSSQEVQKMINLVTLPKLSKNLNRIIAYQIVDNKNPNFSSFLVHKYLLIFLEIKSMLDISNSDEYILDLSNLSLAIVTKYSLMDVMKIVTIIEKVFSNRIAALHLVNVPNYAEKLISIAKTFFTAKLKERFHFHSNYESLLEFYSKDMLPMDFGGDEKPMAELHVDWVKFLDEHEDYFKQMQNVKVNETLRAKKLVNDDILGFHGNFRKLTVD